MNDSEYLMTFLPLRAARVGNSLKLKKASGRQFNRIIHAQTTRLDKRKGSS